MSSHNTKAAFAFHKTPGTTRDDRRKARTASDALTRDVRLSIWEDDDVYCDPYNSTGKHVVLQMKLRRSEG